MVGNGEGCRDFGRGGVENTVRGEADVSYEGVSICFVERNFARVHISGETYARRWQCCGGAISCTEALCSKKRSLVEASYSEGRGFVGEVVE